MKKNVDKDEIFNYIMRNKISVNKNIKDESIILHALKWDKDFAMRLANIKTNFTNDCSTLCYTIENNITDVSEFISTKKLNVKGWENNPLVLAVQTSQYKIVINLLKHEDVNFFDGIYYLGHYAIINDDVDMISILLNFGMNINMLKKNKLMWSTIRKNLSKSMLEILEK